MAPARHSGGQQASSKTTQAGAGTATASGSGTGGSAGRKSRWARCCACFRSTTTFFFSHIGLCGLVLGYAIVGAFTFEALESEHEYEKRQEMGRRRDSFVSALWTMTDKSPVLKEGNWSEAALNELRAFELTVVQAVRKGGYDGNEDEEELQWSFSGALLYSLIVITTIGYGNIAPKTAWGKVVTIFYAIFGIPLMLLCLSNIGDAMAHSFKFLYWKVCCILCVPPDKPKKKSRARSRRRRKRRKKQRLRGAGTTSGGPLTPPGTPLGTSPFPIDKPPLAMALRMQLAGHSNFMGPSTSAAFNSLVHQQLLRPPMPFDPSATLPPSYRMRFREDVKSGVLFMAKTLPTDTPIISNKFVVMSDVEDDDDDDEDLEEDTKLGMGEDEPDDPLRPDLSQVGRRYATLPRSFVINLPLPEYPIDPLEGIDEYGRPRKSSSSHSSDSSDEDEEEQTVSKERNVPIVMCLLVVIGYICGGALLFTAWEKWTFLDSSYFCFVTLTTIGFGDYVPGTAVLSKDEEGQKKLVTCALYLLFGMALLAMSFNLVQEEVTKSVRTIGKRMGILSDDDQSD